MSITQANLKAALALFEAAHKRLQAAIKETSDSRVLVRMAPRQDWPAAERARWAKENLERYDAAVLNEARAEASFERVKDRLENARREADGLPDDVEEARR